MKYLFKNNCGYYKFCRKIPKTNKQFIFSLYTKEYNVSKEIISIFSLKSNSYFLYIKTLSKEKIVSLIYEIENQLNEYKKQSMVEYSNLEKERQLHYSIKQKIDNENGYKVIDGSNPEPIKYWIKELSKYISGEKTDRKLQEFGKSILKRTTLELKQYYQSLNNTNDKITFLQKLIKTESDLLRTDYTRWRENFDLDYVVDKDKSGMMKQILEQLQNQTLQNSNQDTDNINKDIFRTKTKEEIYKEYIEDRSNLPSFKNLKDKIVQPLTILLQSSNKDYFIDYEEEDYLIFFNTLLYTPNGIKLKKKIFIDDYDGNYVLLSQDFQNEEIDLHHYDDLEIQSIKTLKEKLDECVKFLDYCIPNKHLEMNILKDNLKFSYKQFENVAKASQKRLPIEDYELKKMFNLMIENGLYKDNIDYFYIILIGFFSGMRVEEICKLDIKDIQEEDKIHYFNVRGKVKSKSSVRKVPIHKFLIEKFDFLKFVESRKENEKLFNLKPLKLPNKTKYSHYFLRYFYKLRDKFISQNRIETDLISFHSFRHTFTTRLSKKGIGLIEIGSILGHSIDKIETKNYSHISLNGNNKNLQKLYLTDIKYDLEKLVEEYKSYSDFFN